MKEYKEKSLKGFRKKSIWPSLILFFCFSRVLYWPHCDDNERV